MVDSTPTLPVMRDGLCRTADVLEEIRKAIVRL
jgi:hypothetical protein